MAGSSAVVAAAVVAAQRSEPVTHWPVSAVTLRQRMPVGVGVKQGPAVPSRQFSQFGCDGSDAGTAVVGTGVVGAEVASEAVGTELLGNVDGSTVGAAVGVDD